MPGLHSKSLTVPAPPKCGPTFAQRAWAAWLLVACAGAWCVQAAPPPADDEFAESMARPGLVCEYATSPPAAVTVRCQQAQPALWLAAGESPDLRLPANGWTATWQGVIEIIRAGEYRFAVAATGAVRLELDGRVILDLPSLDAAPPLTSSSADATNHTPLRTGSPQTLELGLHTCRVTYVAGLGENLLRFYWDSPNQFPLEPVPPRTWAHQAEDPLAAALQPADPFDVGQRQLEDHRCARCHHLPEDNLWSARLTDLPAPRLTMAHGRLRRSWVFHWLDHPTEHRPQASMPRLFGEDRASQVERYVLASYLAPDDATPTAAEPPRIAEGEQWFWQRGCTVCHLPRDGEPERVSLRHLAGKYLPGALAAFLHDPLASHPAGLMPDMQLSSDEAQSLAAYLSQPTEPQDGVAQREEFAAPPSLDEWVTAFAGDVADADALAAARRLLEPLSHADRTAQVAAQLLSRRRCLACHEFATDATQIPPPAPVPADWITLVQRPVAGCLSQRPAAGVPRYGAALDRAALLHFLEAARTAPAPPSPAVHARQALARLNCTGCHRRDESGGIDHALAERLMHGQSPEQAEALTPPALTAVTDRLTAGYLREVLEFGRRSRPWMPLRMPKFSPQRVRELAAGLAALDGAPLRPAAPLPPVERDQIEAGRRLVGAAGFGCTKCHDMLGIPSGGTRGPELSLVTERVHHDWFLRWMTDPQRIQPGTRMPTVFLDGQSPYSDVLEGDPVRQREALWAYLAHSRANPAPDGLTRPRPLHLAVGVQPRVVRTFLPDLTPRGIAIGFPCGVHVAFDAQTCRLAYAFAGDFLGMSPVWTDRGGRPAEVLGGRVWNSPPGFPWAFSDSLAHPPDFASREQDPAWGAVPPDDAQLHPSLLYFRGYRIAADAVTLNYAWQTSNASPGPTNRELSTDPLLEIRERLATRQAGYAQGILRELELPVARGQVLWLEVARASEPIRFYRTADDPGALSTDVPSLPADAAAEFTSPLGACVAHLRPGSTPALWVAVHQAGQWSLRLALPAPALDSPNLRWNLACWRTTADLDLRKRLVNEVLSGELK